MIKAQCPNCKHRFLTAGFIRKISIKQVEYAHKLLKEGYTYKEIGKKLNCNAASIFERMHPERAGSVRRGKINEWLKRNKEITL